MDKPIIVIKLKPTEYSGLVNLGNRVVTNMTGNSNFTMPAVALLDLAAAVSAVEAALGVWGPIGNRGSHESLVDLRQKALLLWLLIKSQALYVATIAQVAAGSDYPAMAGIMISSGYELAGVKVPQGTLQMPQDFHVFVSRQLNPNQVKGKFKKPLNVHTVGNVKSYNIYMADTPVFADAVQIANVTKTFFIYTNEEEVTVTKFFWAQAVGAAGPGVVTDVLKAIIPSA